MSRIRQDIYDELRKREITCSTQVVNTLYFAATLSGPDFVGCSDSLLIGLLRCGSYTVEALLSSGVDAKCLMEATKNSVAYSRTYEYEYDSDPVEMLFASQGVFGRFLQYSDKEIIETSDLLEISISPEALDGEYTYWFPKELKKYNNVSSEFLKHLEDQVCYIVDTCTEIISRNVYKTLEDRRKALTQPEKTKIRDEIGIYDLSLDQLNWAIELTNSWFTNRELNLNKSETTLAIVSNITQDVRFGASIFAENGGDFKSLTASLDVAKKFAPERDQPLLGLLERDGRIYIKNFSYNNTFAISENNTEIISVGTEIPLPLTTIAVISEFEHLINSKNITENKIQQFLEHYPEILQSLGYASCKPHVILKEPNQKDLIPDFILQKPGNNGFDILDLKLPAARIAVSNPYLRMSHEITKALAQLRAYRNFFKSTLNRKVFHEMHGMHPLSPELIVVIGRTTNDISFADRIEIQKQASGLKILTYDELLSYGKTKAINIKDMANQTFQRIPKTAQNH